MPDLMLVERLPLNPGNGSGARECQPEWLLSLHDQCRAASEPFWIVQWGGLAPKAGGREIDERTWGQMPALSGVPTADISGAAADAIGGQW